MTQKQMLERVRGHHPQAPEALIRVWLNLGLDSFCRQTKILKTVYTFPTVKDQRWYALDDKILEVHNVDYKGYTIPRLLGRPELRDLS